MAAKRPARPAVRSQLVGRQTHDIEGVTRLATNIAEQEAQDLPVVRSVRENVDLVVGTNRLVTGLPRRARGCTLTQTVADASFSWAFAPSGDRMAVITIIGVDQPRATLEFY